MSHIDDFLAGRFQPAFGPARLTLEARASGFQATLTDAEGEPFEMRLIGAGRLVLAFDRPPGKRVRVPGMNLAVEVRGDAWNAEGTVVYCLASRWISLGSPRKLSSVTLLSRAREAIALHPEIDHDVAREADLALAKLEDTKGPFGEDC